jgi:hypothetical protein
MINIYLAKNQPIMNRVQEVQRAYPNYVNAALQLTDPKHKNKYLMWIAAQLSRKHSKEDIRSTVTAFHKEVKRLSKADIYSYKDLKELENEIKDLSLSKHQQEVFVKESGTLKIYNDDLCTMIRINSKTAMLYYGKRSRWCIAMEDEDYWEDYSVDGNVFYVLIDKASKKKFAIQKKGFLDLSIWEENDKDIDPDLFITKHKHLEPAILACLHDREEPVLHRIKQRSATRSEISEWLKYQHPETVKFMDNVSGSAFYLLDVDVTITPQITNRLAKLSLDDLKKIQTESPRYIDKVVDYLANNPKIKLEQFKYRLGHLIPNPKAILSDEMVDFIRLKTDPSVAEKLLNSNKKEIWARALTMASPAIIISLLPKVNKSKQTAFLNRLNVMVNFQNLLQWLSNTSLVSEMPKNIWRSKAKIDYKYEEEDEDEDEG